jgi:molybdopterin molybdotransferase
METDSNEIDEGTGYVGYREAFEIITSNISTVGTEEVPLDSGTGRIAASDLVARVSYPQTDVSLKDGFAVKSSDVDGASSRRPVYLEVVGSVFAGSGYIGEVTAGHAVKICSGAPIPRGAEAVVSGEFCEEVPEARVCVRADADKGRNVLRAGAEVRAGSTIVKKGGRMLPGYLGLAAAAGLDKAVVYRRPRVAVLGVGDEVVAPGERLHPGQLYASNLVTMEAWLASFGIAYVASVVKDIEEAIQEEMKKYLSAVDVILTSGGAWGSERDLVCGSLDRLGWRELFHHVRMGPGKGIAFGTWEGKPVFCLPGGPASNEMAFLQLALPGLLRMSGDTRHPLQTVSARLTEDIEGRHPAWTEFKDAVLTRESDGGYSVGLYRNRSRLQAIASAKCLLCIPEGETSLRSGQIVPVQLLVDRPDDLA